MSRQAPKQQHDWRVVDADEATVVRLAERIALKLARGDVIALSGDLGAGKTTFARALIRAVLGDQDAEIPSPTFSLVQTYATPRLELAHLDLYRIAGDDDLIELGFDELVASGAAIVEWPERVPGLLAANRLDIHLAQGTWPEQRTLGLVGHGTWAPRLARLAAMSDFLDAHPPWDAATAAYLQGDASARAYARLTFPPPDALLPPSPRRVEDSPSARWGGETPRTAILMDQPRQPDGPPIRNGLPYSRIARLAEDVRPFVAVASALLAAGLSAPEIYATDLERGFLVLEDFGGRVFGAEIAKDASQAELWRAATDTLLVLSRVSVPDAITLPDGTTHRVPPQDTNVLGIEVELLPDWYWPAVYGQPIPADVRAEFMSAWESLFARLLAGPKGWVLRDFHSPNLVWLPERDGARRAGLLDFQDALQGPPAYDLVSLLEDARVDVPAALEDELLAYYLDARRAEPAFDGDAFRFAYAVLGVQRNTKILGIFARLAKRDGKRTYLRHIPRLWRYLARGLAHPELAALALWFDRHFPAASRNAPPNIS
ncbi:tRNA (adenosine(37)-N6)-threonylcarbamoyltransferase complex ATPase subunit type 1 TsaE [Hyphomicrobium sp.]|uniref:tRNA (adenosine(37)-N6)-threonylcarbamoyltransferase complex ATPase subunit type 1 TsaE n=1 Tax=Hyphomicrobium sp. TaxID=82 RepID=UPI0025BCD2F5|nr:tRNA (adenosine(37)-N6)-threonylcarbamoyltransferase complex ATPase subunit type 1 TsaE [Hyphomicrobium sp.]MCC7252888.1 tRNA (adenosine(37)-N6)-threonylcarbamoyltransferase complex ATPase subunit type 1 TsaE [Hyphomicrobium sp.]